MAYIYDIADVWASSGTTFTGIKLSVTDTASAAGSLLMDLQVGGVSRATISKSGGMTISTGAFQSGGLSFIGSTANMYSRSTGLFDFAQANTLAVEINYPNIGLSSDYGLAWSSTSGATGASGAKDLFILRDAANTLAQRNGVNAQAFNLYNTYTDASNYERGVMKWASNVLTIGAEKLGTGATRHIRIGPDGLSGVGLAGGNATTTHAVACGDSTASAFYAFAAINGVASGTFSAAIGRAVTASGTASVAMGYFTNAYQANQYALGFSTFDISTGTVVNQTSTFVLNASTTNATATEMGTGYNTFSRMVVRASTTWAFEITVAARSDGGVDNATYMYRGMIKRDASNNTTLVGTVDNFYTNETNAAWDVAVTADDTTESLKIMVTGAAATNINWTAKAILTEVGNV